MTDIEPYHELNDSSFEDLVIDLFNAKEQTNTYIKYGRRGQKQDGIDIISNEKSTAIQCKFKDNLRTDKQVKTELKREIKNDAQAAIESGLDFSHFILVSTYHHDTELQYYAKSLQDELESPFNISYLGWEEIRKYVLKFPEIQSRYFRKLEAPFQPIEVVSISVDSENCAWERKAENTFYQTGELKSEFPILDFSLINHLDKTILLKSIHLWAFPLPAGLSGILTPTGLQSSHKYQMDVKWDRENVLLTNPPLQIPKEQAFRFQLELVKSYDGQFFPFDSRWILYFTFHFNSNIEVTLPKLYLNTRNDSKFFTITVLR